MNLSFRSFFSLYFYDIFILILYSTPILRMFRLNLPKKNLNNDKPIYADGKEEKKDWKDFSPILNKSNDDLSMKINIRKSVDK